MDNKYLSPLVERWQLTIAKLTIGRFHTRTCHLLLLVLTTFTGLLILHFIRGIHLNPCDNQLGNNAYSPLVELDAWPIGEPWSDVIQEHHLDYGLIETTKCHNRNNSELPIYLVGVLSNPAASARRKIIRDTWGNPRYVQLYRKKFKAVFMLFFIVGSVDDPAMMEAVAKESMEHHDIIQGRFFDSYRNLSMKVTFFLKWASQYCQNAEYLIRTSDDEFFNVFNLFGHMPYIISKTRHQQKVVIGRIEYRAGVVRQPFAKFYTTKDEYPADIYPFVILGHGVIFKKGLIKFLYERAIRAKYFRPDDVFLSLLLHNVSDVTFYNLGELVQPFFGGKGVDSDTSAHLTSIFVHLLDRTVYLQYPWWANVLKQWEEFSKEDRSILNFGS